MSRGGRRLGGGRTLAFGLVGGVAVLAGGCSSGASSGAPSLKAPSVAPASTLVTTTAAPERPAGPAAAVVRELSGGNGVNLAAGAPPDDVLRAAQYEQHEFEVSGTATSFVAPAPLPANGRWTFTPTTTAAYSTRIVVRRPSDPAKATGDVVVEWLNVSSGLDADPEWQTLHEELTRQGIVWVGVSAQVIGVNGGPVLVTTPQSVAAGAGRGLRAIDPARYRSLQLPGDGYSFDIFTQVARLLRGGGDVLGGLAPRHLVAAGESQSAFALVTYINGVDPLAHAFDAFFVHSRAANGLPLAAEGKAAGIADALSAGGETILRTDTTAPIMEVQTETDVAGILMAVRSRQDDTDRFRLWEVAGTAHADRHLVGPAADQLGCGAINDGPMHLVAKAGFRALELWVAKGAAPPMAPRLEVREGGGPVQVRDGNGIARGGIRTPLVDVPVDVLSGQPGASASAVCILSGSTTPLPAAVIAQLYPTRADYQQRYAAAADAAVAAGFVLPDDRDTLMAYFKPERVGG